MVFALVLIAIVSLAVGLVAGFTIGWVMGNFKFRHDIEKSNKRISDLQFLLYQRSREL